MCVYFPCNTDNVEDSTRLSAREVRHVRWAALHEGYDFGKISLVTFPAFRIPLDRRDLRSGTFSERKEHQTGDSRASISVDFTPSDAGSMKKDSEKQSASTSPESVYRIQSNRSSTNRVLSRGCFLQVRGVSPSRAAFPVRHPTGRTNSHPTELLERRSCVHRGQ